VTCEDFVAAMAEAAGRDLGQFRRWYSQAGTPRLEVRGEYDAATRRYDLTVAQSTPPTAGRCRYDSRARRMQGRDPACSS
ncbi:MAG: pepN, partial [Geminicoccaceae bacterium]|nr:pepN [Geminicoccaceae bacterium]